jgi:hypothetical protein
MLTRTWFLVVSAESISARECSSARDALVCNHQVNFLNVPRETLLVELHITGHPTAWNARFV